MPTIKELYFGQQVHYNTFAQRYEVALGYNTWKGNVKKDKITKVGMGGFGAYGIISRSGYGKSVLFKRIMAYLLGYFPGRRCGLIFDMQGEDHHLSRKPNSKPYPLFKEQGEVPFGLSNIVSYTPCFKKKKAHPKDKLFAFSLADCDWRDLKSLDLTPKSAHAVYRILNEHNIQTLSQLRAHVDDLSHSGMKDSVHESLNLFELDDVFRSRNDSIYKKSFVPELKEGKVIVINYHKDREYSPLYLGIIARDLFDQLEKDRRSGTFEIPNPVLGVEEADIPLTKEDKHLHKGSNYHLTEFLRRGRTHGALTLISTQKAAGLNEEVSDHVQSWILGDLTPSDQEYFKGFLSKEIMTALKNLDRKKNSYGAREWLIAYDNDNFDTFRPANSPNEIKRQAAHQTA